MKARHTGKHIGKAWRQDRLNQWMISYWSLLLVGCNERWSTKLILPFRFRRRLRLAQDKRDMAAASTNSNRKATLNRNARRSSI